MGLNISACSLKSNHLLAASISRYLCRKLPFSVRGITRSENFVHVCYLVLIQSATPPNIRLVVMIEIRQPRSVGLEGLTGRLVFLYALLESMFC